MSAMVEHLNETISLPELSSDAFMMTKSMDKTARRKALDHKAGMSSTEHRSISGKYRSMVTGKRLDKSDTAGIGTGELMGPINKMRRWKDRNKETRMAAEEQQDKPTKGAGPLRP